MGVQGACIVGAHVDAHRDRCGVVFHVGGIWCMPDWEFACPRSRGEDKTPARE